jgi:hypothetical protein
MALNIWQLLYFYLIGLFLALLEIQIEGADGWAKNLPTKRFKVRWYLKLGKEITGYHLILQIFLLLFMHLPMVLEKRSSWPLEILILSQYLFFIVYWDFLWFVLNPNFRLKNFKKGLVSWHTHWLLGLPVDYWLYMMGGLILPVIFLGWSQFIIQLFYLLIYLAFISMTISLYYIFFRLKL